MRKPRYKTFDAISKTITYLATSFSVIILVLILGFVISKGSSRLSFEMLSNDYWAKNYFVEFENSGNEATEAYQPEEFEYYSRKYDFALKDFVTDDNQNQVILSYVGKDSIINAALDASVQTNKIPTKVKVGSIIQRIEYRNLENEIVLTGGMFEKTAFEIIEELDNSESLTNIYYQSQSGGIFGSIKATLLLIGLTLLFALPLGIFAAIYLTEIIKNKRMKNLLSSFIEMLAGIPSIIFGLMGLIALYPITKLFGMSGLSILLGSLTMTVVILPVIIRSVQESLLVVPPDYRSASLSLGATTTQTIFKVILPSALPGIVSAIILAISRIIGESAAIIYTMGAFVNDVPRISEGGTSLAVHIWVILSGEQPDIELASAISMIIIIIILVLNIVVKLISNRFNRKFGG